MIKKLFLSILLSLFCCSCTKKEDISSKPKAVVTIAPYAFVINKIAGNSIQVETLVPPGMNIHTYEPSPKLVESVMEAKIWFRIDEPFEKKIVKVLQERNPDQKIINLQKNLDLLSSHDAIELAPCLGHDHGSYDLHTWLSPKLFLKQATVITNSLIELFPQNKGLFEKNFNDLALELQSLDREIKSILAPFSGNAILASHPAFGYFCKDYDLVQLSVECEGKDPRPKDIEAMIAKTKIYSMRCVLLQQGFNNRGGMLLGKKLQLPIYTIEPYASDYLSNMREIAEKIAR